MINILIAGKFKSNGHNPIGGLQSWMKTVSNELERLGHNVVLWESGDSKKIDDFDLGIFSNIILTQDLIPYCKKTILVSHGIIEAEKPDYSCDKLYFVSEGVRDHWNMNGNIIRQPIDLDFWRCKNNSESLVTRYSYRDGNTHCKWVASQLNKEFVHLSNVSHRQARDVIRNSCLVFATGRAALESMACGTPTVIYDHRQAYQPPLMGEDLDIQMKNSYSGRGGITPTKEQLLNVALNAKQNRQWIVKHHDSKKIVKQLLND